MSQADREKWEARYAGDDGGEVRRVDPFLEQVAEELPSSGRALDLAGGTGRNALFLSRRGLDVTLVDISSQGLARARSAAEAEGLSISTQSLDLDEKALRFCIGGQQDHALNSVGGSQGSAHGDHAANR